MVKVKKNNRNFEVKKYIKKTTPALMSLLVATSCLNGVHYPKNAYASGVTQKINTGDGGVKVLYANNGLNPLNFSIGDAATYGNKNVEDVVKITVTFPKNNGQNDYGPESKKVHIKYEFNSNKGAYWSGRPFYWFSLPKNVKEPSNIKITNASGNSDSIQNWRQWATNTRFVASRYQNMQDAIAQNEGHPHDWGRFNDRTEEYQKGFNGSFNYQFNRMLDEQDGGWFDENGGTRNFAKSIRNNSKSIYIDWEPRGDGKVTIEVDTEVMFPLKSNTLDFAAGAFSVLGNIRIANMQTVTTPHYITYAEKYALDTPETMEVENPNNIGEEKKKEIIKKLKEEPKNKDKTKYLVEENKYDDHKQQIEVKDNGDTTITFRDLSQQTIAGSRLVTKHVPYKDRFGIKIPQTTEVKKVDSLDSNEINKVKNAIYEANKDNKDFLEGIGNDKNKITVDKTGKAKITYKDNSSHEIEANKLVTRHIPLSEKYEPLISVTTGVVNKDSLTTAEQEKVKQVLVEINKRANHAIMDALENGEESIVIDSKGKATLTYKDKSTDTIDPSRLIYQIPKMNERYEPNLIARLGSDNPTDLKEAEKKQLKEALWNANTNLHDKLKGKDKDKSITIEKDGKATFTYEDDTKDVIPGEYLVYKKGEKASPVTRLVQNGDKKYYLTPIVVNDMNSVDKNKFADALRRFLFDNYTWNGKEENFEKEVKKSFLTVTGGYIVADDQGWLERKLRDDVRTHNIKAKPQTQNMGMPDKIVRIGYESSKQYLDFRHLSGWTEDQYFKLEKDKLFITNGGAFDVDKAKKEADDIIDKLKNEKGLSKDEADKLKKEIEDAKGNGTLNQDKINEIIKKANEQAKKDSEAEKLKKAKDEAEKELKKLNDIKDKDKKDAENNIKQADTIDKVQKALDEAKKKDQEEKAKKEAEALLKKQKEEAKKVINSLSNLEKGEKEPYTKSNGSIDQAKDEKAINDLVEKAKAQDKANADKKALDEAKKKAKEIINKLEHLDKQEKEAYTKQTTGSVDKADTQEKVKEEIKKAQDKDKENKLKLDQAKNKAKEDIGKLKHLSPEERKQFNENIDKAKDQTAIDNEVKKAQEKDKQNAKSKAINDVNNSGLTDEEKKQAEKDINNAGSTDEIDKKAEEHLKKVAEEKAKKEKEEADKLKDEYKQKIENTQGLDKTEKEDYKNQINQATTKGQMDSIVEMAQAKAKQKQAKEEIDKLSHLNKKQKESLKDNIDNLISDTDINNEVSKANDLDSKMDTLQKLVAKTAEQDVKDRLNNAKQQDKTNYEKALAEAKKVSEKETGVDADSSTVEQLTKDLEEAINKLNPSKPKVKIDINKEALNKEIKKAKELKEKDIYKNSETKQKTDFESKLKEAEKIANDNNATQDKVEQALADLINAENNLNGKFKLETKDSTPALVGVSDNDGTKVEKETDKKSILDKIKDMPKDAVTSISPVKTDKGKKVVTVTVVKDNVSQTIDIPIKSDTTKPTVQVTNENQDIYKTEEFKEMKITATDENLDTTKDYITVEGLDNNSWLTYDKATKTIKLKNGNTVPKTATTTKVTIKVVDKVGNEQTKDVNITVKNQADKYKPKAKSDTPTRKVVGEKVNSPKDYVENTDKNTQLPQGTTFKWKENNTEKDEITLNEVGNNKEKEVVVTYPDGSKTTVKVKFNVIDKKPDVPTVTAKDNGDVTIKPAPNTDKISVTYTPTNENAEKTVEIEKDTDGKWKIPAEFSQNDSGEITIPDTVTKNNTAVKVKASNGTSGYTTEKSTTITAKELQEVKTPVTIAGSDNKDTDVTENNRKLILDSLTSDQKGEANASIEQDAKIKEEAGKKYVEVKLEFKDKSTKVIKVPVVGDSTAPQVELSNDNQTVYKKEGFTEIKVNATDSNLADKPIEVKDLPNWLQYDETGKTIKFANGTTEVPTTATTTTVKVIAKDKVGNTTTKEIVITVKSQSDKYSPETLTSDGSKIKKVQGEQSNDAKSYVKNAKDLPEQTKYSWKDEKANPKFDQVGEVEKTITVTFPDGSEKEVKVKFNVVDTKPSEPAVAALKNGDITITPSADSDKVVVGYTPKDSDQEKLVEAKKDQGKWNLPEGFKEENGKIIIPDEITKNNTTVKVKASKGTSDYTPEVTKQLSKTELLPPLKATISGSDAKDTVLTKENADLIKATLTNAQTGGATPSIKDGEKIKEDTDGSKYVEVTLTYDDQSTKVIKVPVVGDSTGPVFEGLGDASVKKYETFKPIEIKATDAGSALRDNQPYEVENLPSWLEFDKATNKVKLANALTRVPKEATTVKFKVKAYDKFNNVTEQEVTVTVNEAEEFTFEKPVIIKGKDKDKEKLSPEDEKTILDAVRGTNKLDGAEPSIVDKTIKVSGDESSVDVTLTYDDNQTRVINVKVEQDAKLKFGLHLPSEKVEVNDINNLNQVEQAKVLEKVKLANSDLKEKDGYTYTIVAVTGQDKKAGTVTVAKDGKVVGELPGERLVKERDITKYDVVLPKVKVQVENKTNLKADEKEKVKEALENATDAKGVSNKDKFPKGTKLEVQGDGTVIISYPDKTTKTILGSDLVDGPSPYVKTIAEEVTPKVPAEKVKVANPSSLDDKEIAKVKEKILEANKDTFPANTTVEVAKDGTATITYKDGSSDTIKNTDLVEKAKEKLTDAKQNPAVKPNAKVEVEDSKKLTDDEKAKVKENVKNTNPKAKDIVVGTDGTVEITYPDGSGNTIKPEDTVVQKAGKTPKESEAVKNPAKVPAVKVQVADTTKLTAEEIAKVKEEVTKVNPNATKVEVSSNGTATLTYKDGSENIVAGEKLVEQKAKGKTLAETVEILVPDVKTEVINPNRLSTAEKEKVKENLKAKNAGKLDSANITVQNNGTVTVEFADGSAKTIDGEKLVTKKADDGKLKPTIADLTDVDAPIYTKVAEYGKLTEIEKEAVKKAVIEANGGEDGKLKDADIKVLGDGTVVITYKDKSTDIIPADKTVNVGQSGSEALVQPALPEYPLDKLKPVADDFITEETQKIKDEINDSNIYSKEEKQKALAKIDEMVKKAKQKVQNAENDDKVLNTINEVLQDAKEFSKNIKENKLAEIAKAKAEAKAEIDKLANLTDEQKSDFKAEVDKAENLSDVKEVLDKAKAKDKEELDKAKAEAKSQIDKLANLTDEQKSSFKKDIQAGKDKNTVAKILDKAKEANKKVKGKAGAKEKAKGQSTLAKTGLNTTNTVGLGAIISLIALALRRKFKK